MVACFTDFKKAIAGLMDPEEADQLIAEAQDYAKARMEKRLEGRAEALNKSVAELVKEREIEAKRARRRALQNVVKRVQAEQQIRQFKNKARGLWAYFGGIESNVPMGRVSVSAQLVNEECAIKSFFVARMERANLRKEFDTIKNGPELSKALYDPEADVSPNIRKLSTIIKDTQEFAVKQLNAEGADIKIAHDYVAHLTHNTRLMGSATGNGLSDASLHGRLLIKHKGNWPEARKEYVDIAYNRWRNEIAPKLDEGRTFERVPQEKREKFLRGVYEALITGIHKVPYNEQGNPLLTRTTTNLAKKLSEGRVLFFKDGESWDTYNKLYGYGTAHDAVISQLETMAKSLAVMKRMGTSPRVFAENLIRKFVPESRDLSLSKSNARLIWSTKNVIKTILGDTDRVPDGLSGRILNNFRNIQYMSKLGNIVPSSIPDLKNMIFGLKQHHIPAMDVTREAMVNLVKGLPKGKLMQVGLDLGTYSDGTMGNLLNKYGAVDSPAWMFSKMMQLNEKTLLINRWDNVNRWTMGSMLSRNLAKSLGTDFEKLPASEQRTLRISGIDNDIWKLLQANKDKVPIIDHKKFLTPQIMDDISDEDILKYVGKKRLGQVRLNRLRQEIKDRMGIYFTDQTAYGKVFPNASDRGILNMGVNANSLPGQLWRLATMFKSFHLASMRRTYGRFLYGGGAENLYDATIGGKGDMKGMLNYSFQSLPWGYISYAAQSLARGEMPPSLDDPETWFRSWIKGGGAGMAGGFIYGSPLRSALGPGFGTITDVGKLLAKVAEGKKVGNAAINLASRNMPLINTFWMHPFIEHSILNAAHDQVDPTYLLHKQLRAQQHGVKYWWKPTTNL